MSTLTPGGENMVSKNAEISTENQIAVFFINIQIHYQSKSLLNFFQNNFKAINIYFLGESCLTKLSPACPLHGNYEWCNLS